MEEQRSQWGDMPVELLALIFRHLSHRSARIAGRTCKWWHSALTNIAASRGCLNLSRYALEPPRPRELNELAEGSGKKRGGNRKRTKRRKGQQKREITDAFAEQLAASRPAFTHLDLGYCEQLSAAGVRKLLFGPAGKLSRSKKLVHLSLRGCTGVFPPEYLHMHARTLMAFPLQANDDLFYSTIARYCVNLRYLDLSYCGIARDTLFYIGQHLAALETLLLVGLAFMDVIAPLVGKLRAVKTDADDEGDYDYYGRRNKPPKAVADNNGDEADAQNLEDSTAPPQHVLQRLRVLDLSINATTSKNQSRRHPVQNWHQNSLYELRGLKSLTKQLTGLEVLRLSGRRLKDPTGRIRSQSLKELCIRGCGVMPVGGFRDVSFSDILQHCPKLKTLTCDLWFWSLWHSRSIHLSHVLANLASTPRLKVLNIGTPRCRNCWTLERHEPKFDSQYFDVFNSGFSDVLKLPKLKHFAVMGCCSISTPRFTAATAAHLKSLKLAQVHITSDTLAALLGRSKNTLTSLDLSRLHPLAYVSIPPKNHLKTLCISGCKMLSTVEVSCPNLRHFTCSANPCLVTITLDAPNLVTLSLNSMGIVTEVELVQKLPKLSLLQISRGYKLPQSRLEAGTQSKELFGLGLLGTLESYARKMDDTVINVIRDLSPPEVSQPVDTSAEEEVADNWEDVADKIIADSTAKSKGEEKEKEKERETESSDDDDWEVSALDRIEREQHKQTTNSTQQGSVSEPVINHKLVVRRKAATVKVRNAKGVARKAAVEGKSRVGDDAYLDAQNKDVLMTSFTPSYVLHCLETNMPIDKNDVRYCDFSYTENRKSREILKRPSELLAGRPKSRPLFLRCQRDATPTLP